MGSWARFPKRSFGDLETRLETNRALTKRCRAVGDEWKRQGRERDPQSRREGVALPPSSTGLDTNNGTAIQVTDWMPARAAHTPSHPHKDFVRGSRGIDSRPSDQNPRSGRRSQLAPRPPPALVRAAGNELMRQLEPDTQPVGTQYLPSPCPCGLWAPVTAGRQTNANCARPPKCNLPTQMCNINPNPWVSS